MKKTMSLLGCAAIPLIISALAKQIWNVSDIMMVAIYFVIFIILYIVAKICKLI